ncbi:hypothetical protein [Ralstonia pseudosolanacearum]|uniref:hypothetical protein n=1 Tax=Ralstonia pseudosolanacearum TaxID=1310165 RepID=UPI001FF8AE96|nr:hypothetical protein [Ralstonia pseudosolanacearum]
METTVKAKRGAIDVRTERRADNRWASQYRFVPNGGCPCEWTPAFSPEGFLTEGMALTAAILQGKLAAEGVESTA